MASQVKKRSGNSTGNGNKKETSSKRSTTKKGSAKGTSKGRSASSKSSGTSSGRKVNSKAANEKRIDEKDILISNDIKIISGFALMILLLLSNFSVIGKAGDIISAFMFGIFGLFAYIVPVLIFIAISFFIANVSSRNAMRKLAASIILFIMLCTILQLIYSGTEMGFKLGNIYTECSKVKNGGGLLGGLVAAPLYALIGIYGAYIVTFAVVIVCMVVISEKSFVAGVKKHSKSAYVSAKEDFRKMKESSAKRIEKREQNKLTRVKNTVRGVNLTSKVTDENVVNADVHELLNTGVLYRGHVDVEELEPHKTDRTGYETIEKGRMEDSIDAAGSFHVLSPVQDTSRPDTDIYHSHVPSDVLKEEEDKKADTEVKNGEFKPRERIEVSKAAKAVMNRKAFSGVAMPKEVSNDIPVPDVNSGITKQPISAEQAGRGVKSKNYVMPPLSLLRKGAGYRHTNKRRAGISETALKLQETLDAFGVKASVVNESRGPSVTRYELQPETGTKVSKITSLADDIKLNLAASDIRIEAPIPGKAAVGIEVPNDKRESVFLRDLIESEELSKHPSRLAFAAGMDIAGKVIVADIAKMPHMLIAGTTGSGKSVFTNSIIMSILFRAKPSEVRLIIVDPKVVEFGVYNGIPHLLTPVVTDPRKAAGALNWAVGEMGERYKLFAKYNVRDLKGYNEKIKQMNYMDGDEKLSPQPQIVIIIDELADLMMVAAKEVESSICRLAQLARAAGIHLIIATQRPSVDVVTGLIKANIPSRVALLVSSGTDSRTIIDCNGGEKLLGNGDMLFYPSGYVKPVRLQGAFVSDEEVQSVVSFLINNNQDVRYNEEVTNAEVAAAAAEAQGSGDGDERDVLFEQAARFVIEKEKGSTSMLQRMFKIGFNRAARIVEQLEQAGVVGPDEGTKPRKVLMTLEEFEQSI